MQNAAWSQKIYRNLLLISSHKTLTLSGRSFHTCLLYTSQIVLELRQKLAKSSVKKYQTMERAVCDDGRARGLFAFYGTNRTGRWAGRLIQLQNLPQNHLPDLADARSLVKSGDFDAVKLLYEDVPDTLDVYKRQTIDHVAGCSYPKGA